MKFLFYSGLFLTVLSFPTGVFASTFSGTLSGGIVIQAPDASPAAGTYTSAQNVTLTATSSTSILYTTDGTDPSCSGGTTFSSAIGVGSSLTLKAISCYSGGASSTVASFGYAINIPAPAPAPENTGGGGGGGQAFGSSPSAPGYVVIPPPTPAATPAPATAPEGEVLGVETETSAPEPAPTIIENLAPTAKTKIIQKTEAPLANEAPESAMAAAVAESGNSFDWSALPLWLLTLIGALLAAGLGTLAYYYWKKWHSGQNF